MLTLGTSAMTDNTTDEKPRPNIGKTNVQFKNDLLTPELLWAMGRIGNVVVSSDDKTIIYEITYYSVAENMSHTVLYAYDVQSRAHTRLTSEAHNERNPIFVGNSGTVAFMSNKSGTYQLWTMTATGNNRKQITDEQDGLSDFLFSPTGKHVMVVKDVTSTTSIAAPEKDLPKTSGMVINDIMYKHWDHFVKSVPHPFVGTFDGEKVSGLKDIMKGEPYEAPLMPFGGREQFAWSPDGKSLAYTSRKKTGKAYAISTDSDIFLYNLADGTTKNLCKPSDYNEPPSDPTRSLQYQEVNMQDADYNVGYDTNPTFSPDGQYVAWLSMERDGYESDRNRLCVYNIATGAKKYVAESFESSVDTYTWSTNGKNLYFTGVWHAMTNIYRTNLNGEVVALTQDTCDYALMGTFSSGKTLVAKKHSISSADEIYLYHIAASGKGGKMEQISFENKNFYDNLTFGKVDARWVNTVDGKQELCWVIYPPHFDPAKKYPTLLYCQGGPQSPVSQFWSFRWNFQLMAANGYIIIAPNRRGLPGFGMEWLEAISGDYSGLCMQDYLAAIDDISKEPYVDTDRLGAVGASFGGYSVYWLAGNHDKRFKCFIAHDGIFNTQQQYLETEELWFANWDFKAAPWITDSKGNPAKVYTTSPHLYVDKWDTPILCIHGMKDYRILNSQTESAYQAARLRGIQAQMLLFPEENHWVTRPQNGILWQRTFYRWLDRWLK